MKIISSVNRSLGLSQDNIFRKLFRIINYSLELLLVRLHHKSSSRSRDIVDQFHSLYYCSPEKTWNNTRWMGRRTMRCPLDLWVYQEILYELKPDITFLIDVSSKLASKRRKKTELDRIEKVGNKFQEQVRDQYLKLASKNKNRFVTLDGKPTPDYIHNIIWNKFKIAIKKRKL